MVYKHSDDFLNRFFTAMKAVMAFPFIDGIEDFVVESLLAHTLSIKIPDPFFETRSKMLFDVVDHTKRIGWSVKSVLYPFSPGRRIELVIQRADIFKKASSLGFSPLSKDSDPNVLGKALLKHWQLKINEDAVAQGVDSQRIFILLKQKSAFEYAVLEEDIKLFSPDEIEWHWTDASKTGLQGTLTSNGQCIYRWYPNQKQLFEAFWIPHDVKTFKITPQRLPTDKAIQVLSSNL